MHTLVALLVAAALTAVDGQALVVIEHGGRIAINAGGVLRLGAVDGPVDDLDAPLGAAAAALVPIRTLGGIGQNHGNMTVVQAGNWYGGPSFGSGYTFHPSNQYTGHSTGWCMPSPAGGQGWLTSDNGCGDAAWMVVDVGERSYVANMTFIPDGCGRAGSSVYHFKGARLYSLDAPRYTAVAGTGWGSPYSSVLSANPGFTLAATETWNSTTQPVSLGVGDTARYLLLKIEDCSDYQGASGSAGLHDWRVNLGPPA